MWQNIISERFYTSLNKKKHETHQMGVMDFIRHNKTLSYCFECLQYNMFAYFTFVCWYPFIWILKISST